MKYRRLTNDELGELEPEFIKFLASNTVTGDDWEKIKKENPEQAEGLIEIFSDIVFDKTIAKVEYLQLKTPKDIKTFHCKEEDIEMMGLMVEGETNLDFTVESLPPQEMMAKLQTSGAKLKLYSAEKKYKDNREQEIFKMMQWGSLISDGTLFNSLKSMRG